MLSCIQKIIDFRGRTPKKLGMDWSESGYLALSALNVKDGYIDFSQDVHYGDQALYDKWMSGNELHKGQVLFTTEAPMGNVAQVPYNKQYILSQRTIAFDVKEDIITENFLATLLKSPVVFNTLTSLSSGGTAKGISQKSLAGVDVRIPVDLREQTLLATYFHNIDHLITLHQRKVESLIKFKKGMLQKMFPKEGCDIPEIRFKGCYDEYGNWVAFTDPWEQRKLGDEAEEILAGGDIDKEKAVDDGVYPIYANALTNDGIVGYYDDYYRVKAPAVTVTGRGEIGRARARMIDFTPVVRLLAVRSNHDCYFLENAINNHKVVVESTGVPQLTVPQLSSYDICFPKDIVEEKKIGTYFNQLDHLITLHQRKIDKLKNLKKAMLDKMFI